MCSGLSNLPSFLISLVLCSPFVNHTGFPFLIHQERSLLQVLHTGGLYPHFFALLTATQPSHHSSMSLLQRGLL